MSTASTPVLPVLRLTSTDHERIRMLLDAAIRAQPKRRETFEPLRRELARAEIVAPNQLPAEVVAMGSRVEIEDVGSGEVDRYTLCYPEHADGLAGRLSILAPIGMAIIGFKQGDTFAWRTPGGTRELRLRLVEAPAEA